MTHRRRLLAPVLTVALVLSLAGCWSPGGPGPEVCDPEDLGVTQPVLIGADGEATIESCLRGTTDEDTYWVVPPSVPGTLGIGCVAPIDHAATFAFVTTGAGGGATGLHSCFTVPDLSEVPFDSASTATITIADGAQPDVSYTLLLTFTPE